MGDSTFFLLVALLVVFVGFQQWLRHQRRVMVHRERLAAIEKGVELPPVEQETRRVEWNVRRILLFAGLVWISIGGSAYLALNRLIGQPPFQLQMGNDRFGNPIWGDFAVRDGMQWIGAGIVGIGIAHLVVYALAKRQHRE